MRHIKRIAYMAILASFFHLAALAQNDQTGFPAFSSLDRNVNLSNLNFHLSIPVLHKSGRGLPFAFDLTYDSTIYRIGMNPPGTSSNLFTFVIGDPNSFTGNSTTFGWTTSGPGGFVGSTQTQCNSKAYNTHFYFSDARGTIHRLPDSVVTAADPSCGPSQASAFTTDQSGIFVTVDASGNGTVRDPNGVTFSNGSMIDANGNTISYGFDPTFTKQIYTDTLGVSALTISSTADSTGNHTLSTTYSYQVPNGGTGSLVVNYKIYPGVASGFGCPNTDEFAMFGQGGGLLGGSSPGVALVDNIVLATGDKYTFTYEPTPTTSPKWQAGAVTGRLASVTLPTGGTITFGYPGPNGGIKCDDGTLLQLTVSTSDGTRTYSRYVFADQSGEEVLVTDAQGNQAHLNFLSLTNPQTAGLSGWIESARDSYQGKWNATSPILLSSIIHCYNGQTTCNRPVSLPITKISTFSSLGTAKQNQVDEFLDSNTGLPTEVDEYDFAANPPGPLLRKTLTSYTTLGNNIHRPASTTTCAPGGADADCGGSGTKAAQQTFGYDETPPTATAGIPQHQAVSGSRGNMTSSHGWLNTTGGTVDTVNVFDDTGNVLSTSDPGGHTTSVTFGTGSCNNAFPTQTTMPDTHSPNLAHHTTSATYDCNTGLLLTSTDQNGNVTKFFYDNMFHQTEVDFPGGGNTKTSYPSLNQTVVQTAIDSTRSTYSTTFFDGYGRTSRTGTANGETASGTLPYDLQDSCYNSNGRLGFRSYSYQGNAPTSAAACPSTGLAGDTFSYDALGRTTSVQHSDGSVGGTSYAGLATQVTDEGNGSFNVSRIFQNDGLGRLASVCEISSSALVGQSPGSCNMDISGTGFVTTYGYDTLGNLTSVSQGALANRQYAYDSLSRMTSETTPEAGTISYTYNADSLLATRVRPAPNQSSASVTVTTTYSYDELHRLMQQSYSDGQTPTANFVYDSSPGWGVTPTNITGRLTEAYTTPLVAAEIFGYDAMGRVIMNHQCTPRTCGTSAYNLDYTYDLIGDMTTFTNGEGVTFTNSYNIAPRLTGMSSTLSDANHPATLLTGASYSPSKVTNTLGNGVLETTSFSQRGMLASYAGALPNGQPGTGSVTISGGEQSSPPIPAQPGSASITISGEEQSITIDPCYYPRTCPKTIWDRGRVTITVNGHSDSTSWGSSSTAGSIAAGLVNAINGDSASPVTAALTGDGTVVTVTSKATGFASNYSFSTSASNVDTTDFSASFGASPASGSLSGGADAVPLTYDSGTTTITVNGHGDSYAWSGSATTAASIAQGLCNAINSDSGAPASANTNGSPLGPVSCPLGSATVTLVAKVDGQNYSLSAASSSPLNSFSVSCPGFPNCISALLTGGGNPIYSFALTHAPDGQVSTAGDFVNGNWSFTYDQFNRLAGSNKNSGQVAFGYGYDRYGNRWTQAITQGAGPSPQYTFDNNNRIVGSGTSYDAVGNILTDGLGNSFTWDAEGRLIQAQTGVGTVTYVYDAEGRRVRGPNGEYLYDLSGRMITQLGLDGTWNYGEIYAGGSHLATYSGGTTNFFHADWLGTKRAMSGVNGFSSQTCTGLPFGDGVSCTGTNWGFNSFTDDIHDPETNLEHTLFRKYSTVQGRWLTPDPAGTGSADPTNPQSWNRYAYVLNDPVNLIDPTGLEYGCAFYHQEEGDICLADAVGEELEMEMEPDPNKHVDANGFTVGDTLGEPLGNSSGELYWNPNCQCWDASASPQMLKQVHEAALWQIQRMMQEDQRPMTSDDLIKIPGIVGAQTKPFTQAANCVIVGAYDFIPFAPPRNMLGVADKGLHGGAAGLEKEAKKAPRPVLRGSNGRLLPGTGPIGEAADVDRLVGKIAGDAAHVLGRAAYVVAAADAIQHCREELR